jgi:hypothetical protein
MAPPQAYHDGGQISLSFAILTAVTWAHPIRTCRSGLRATAPLNTDDPTAYYGGGEKGLHGLSVTRLD